VRVEAEDADLRRVDRKMAAQPEGEQAGGAGDRGGREGVGDLAQGEMNGGEHDA
jgi:hypothetical protein